MNSLYKKHTKFFKVVGLLFHFSGALQFTVGIVFDYQLIVPGQTFYLLQRLQYMTYWNLYLQWFYFTKRTINDIMTFDDNDEDETPKCVDYIKTSLAIPNALTVSILFWTIYTLDPSLIHGGEPLPRYLNFVVHTSVSLLNLIELAIVKQRICPQKKCLWINFCFSLVFTAWFIAYNMTENKWTYPFLDHLDILRKAVFFSSCCLMNFSLCILGQNLQYLIWG
ncbi:androgen-dependent TFPI-regulating protein-like [Cimex lectularius]|uniref:Uncharacterized protein n=1 Tax=Cimex lectularius TaxID=79782 RepID=A0A8I6S0B0_CIMLE|nr:androgen-dependent TFPI-regulating protein-like [Cimex lectularius]